MAEHKNKQYLSHKGQDRGALKNMSYNVLVTGVMRKIVCGGMNSCIDWSKYTRSLDVHVCVSVCPTDKLA